MARDAMDLCFRVFQDCRVHFLRLTFLEIAVY